MTCQRPGPFRGRCHPAANSSADLGLVARSSEVRPDVVDLRVRRALAESQCPARSRPLVIASRTGGLTQGRCDRIERARSRPGAHGNRYADRRDITELTLALTSRGVRSSVLRLPPTVHGDGDNEFMKAVVGIARDNGVSGLPRARHPGIQHAHPRPGDWQPSGQARRRPRARPAGVAGGFARLGCRAGVTGAGSPVRVLAGGRAGPRRERARCAAWSSGSARRESCGEPASRHWPH